MNKKIINKDTLTPKLLEGMQEIASIVKRTLGPGGLPIIIERVGQALDGSPLTPKLTKDGVSVADECGSADLEKDLAIQTVKAICRKTNTIAGDGTTTAIVLGEAILNETFKALTEDASLNPQLVREELEKTSKIILARLDEMTTKIDSSLQIKQVATISANGDEEIGSILAEAFKRVGAEGIITVDEGHGPKNSLDVVEGYQFQRGAEGQNRFFNNKELTKFEAENARLIIYDGKLSNYVDLIAPLTNIAARNDTDFKSDTLPPIVVIANDFSNEVIQFLLMQRAEQGLSFCAVRGPNTTSVRSGYYEDLAVMSGGYKFGNGNRSLSNFEEGDEGVVSKIIIDKYTTTIYDGQGSEEDVLKRVEQLQALKLQAESPYDRQITAERLAALTGGIAKIGVGGSTELEVKEKYDRIEDALNASRAAILEGVVVGGGVALLRIGYELSKKKDIGSKIMAEALKAPFFQILENVGIMPENIENIQKMIKKPELTYDARNKKVVNAFDAGIIDPVKVTKCALENAVSIAGLLATAGGGIIYIKKGE